MRVRACVVAVLVACGGGGSATPQGEVGGHCYPNGTCNVGLACVDGVCAPPQDAGVDAPADARADAAYHDAPDAAYHDAPAPVCGNGVVEQGETCDTAIASGSGACPTACNDGDACTTDTLANAGTCTAACMFTPITLPANGDGCCPTGANANNDSDCMPKCGNAVVESGEQCDDGNANNFDGCDTACFAVDTSCMGAPAPTTATATVTVSGTVEELAISGLTPMLAPLAGATVDACQGNCTGGNHLATATSDSAGAFSLGPITTGGTPLDAYFSVAKTGYRPLLLYLATPLVMDMAGLAPVTMTAATFAALASFVGVSQSASDGDIWMSVVDCKNAPIRNTANVTIAISQGGSAVTGTTTIDAGTLSSSDAGIYLIFNVPPGTTQVSATYYGMSLLAHDVNVVAGTTTQTSIRPGP